MKFKSEEGARKAIYYEQWIMYVHALNFSQARSTFFFYPSKKIIRSNYIICVLVWRNLLYFTSLNDEIKNV